MVKQVVHVTCPMGIHLRPAGQLSTEALKFESEIYIQKGNRKSSLKSVLCILSACVKHDDDIEVVCDGPDEEAALEAVVEYIKNIV